MRYRQYQQGHARTPSLQKFGALLQLLLAQVQGLHLLSLLLGGAQPLKIAV